MKSEIHYDEKCMQNVKVDYFLNIFYSVLKTNFTDIVSWQ